MFHLFMLLSVILLSIREVFFSSREKFWFFFHLLHSKSNRATYSDGNIMANSFFYKKQLHIIKINKMNRIMKRPLFFSHFFVFLFIFFFGFLFLLFNCYVKCCHSSNGYKPTDTAHCTAHEYSRHCT